MLIPWVCHKKMMDRENRHHFSKQKARWWHWLWYWLIWRGRAYIKTDLIICGSNPIVALGAANKIANKGRKIWILLSSDANEWNYELSKSFRDKTKFKGIWNFWINQSIENKVEWVFHCEFEKWCSKDECLVVSHQKNSHANEHQMAWLKELQGKVEQVWPWEDSLNIKGGYKKRLFFYNEIIWVSEEHKGEVEEKLFCKDKESKEWGVLKGLIQ